ncbi:MAG: hypothetical protein JKY23_05145 [Nitrospinaceae bacterium]|nr:hypothetical protein [Nitrospinaceae bacterium]
MQLRIRESQNSQAPFHDGMHEEKVRLLVDCNKCGHRFDENLLSSLDKGEQWYRSLMESEQRYIAKEFGYKFEIVGPNNIPYARFKNGNVVYFIDLLCPKCNTLTLAVVDFYEMQPARYIATLAGVAEMEAT